MQNSEEDPNQGVKNKNTEAAVLATQLEVFNCVTALSKEQLSVLGKYAIKLAWRYRLYYHEPDAAIILLNDTIQAVLSKRIWKPGQQDFPEFLHSTMKSTAWNMLQKQLRRPDDVHSEIALNSVPSRSREHARVEAGLTLEKLHLRGHPYAEEIFWLKEIEGLSTKEIIDQLKIKPKAYEAARKWIKRRIENFRKGYHDGNNIAHAPQRNMQGVPGDVLRGRYGGRPTSRNPCEGSAD